MSEPSKAKKIGYWATTGLIALGFVGGGVTDLIAAPDTVAMFTELGYPAYLPRFLGLAKVLGAAAILVPNKFPRLAEWAYAGIVFDLLLAAYSHISNGDGPDKFAPPLVFLALAFASYLLRPDDRKLPDAPS